MEDVDSFFKSLNIQEIINSKDTDFKFDDEAPKTTQDDNAEIERNLIKKESGNIDFEKRDFERRDTI